MLYSVLDCRNISNKSDLGDFCIFIDSVVVLDNLILLEQCEFTILYENKGKEIIKLKSVDTFCGCLTEKGMNKTVSPGEIRSLIFSHLPQEIGYMERYIFLCFDKQEDPISFKIKDFVKNKR